MTLNEQKALLDDLKTERVWCLQHGFQELLREWCFKVAVNKWEAELERLGREISATEANCRLLASGLTRSQLVELSIESEAETAEYLRPRFSVGQSANP